MGRKKKEKSETKNLSIRIDPELHRQIAIAAILKDTSVSNLISDACKSMLK